MTNLQRLTENLEAARNPAAALGRFLIAHSNSPEYLEAHLSAFLTAVSADASADREWGGRMLNLGKRPPEEKSAPIP